jgi:hypothetical protein
VYGLVVLVVSMAAVLSALVLNFTLTHASALVRISVCVRLRLRLWQKRNTHFGNDIFYSAELERLDV